MAAAIEEFVRFITAHPLFEQLQMLRIVAYSCQWHLVGAECTLDRKTIDSFWSRPSFRRSEDDHRPGRALGEAGSPRLVLYVANLFVAPIQRSGKLLVHDHGVIAGNKLRCMTMTAKKINKLVLRNAGVYSGAGDLVAIEVQNRKHGSIAHWVEKLVTLPASLEGGGFGFVLCDGMMDLSVAALEQCIRISRRPTVTRTDDANNVGVAFGDEPVQMRVDEVESGRSSPMTQKPFLNVVAAERLSQ